jgi:hypothetical protein
MELYLHFFIHLYDMALTKLGTGRCLVLCLHECKILILHTPQETLEGREYGRRDLSR